MKLTTDLKKWLRKIRRHIHANPEIAYQEVKTAEFIAEKLKELDYTLQSGVAKTGIIATTSRTKDKTIAFRADMDALPLTENKTAHNENYRSKNPGMMHACGHDCHMAIMLGVANILAKEQELRDKINLKFLFQPAEEGGAGAERMIKESALKNPTPDILLAGHVSSQMEVGHFGFVKGIAHAAADTIQITVNGSGGHAARPEKSIDPVVAAASLIMQLQTIITRNIDALSPAVLTIGSIQGGTKSNIIPEVVVLRGTIRTHDKTTRDIFLKRIKEMCKGIDQIFGTTSHFEIGDAYPACFNHVELTEFMYETALELFGNKKVHWINPSMGGEDFAYFTQKVPGTMIRLGCLNTKKGITYPCHNPQFDVDERVLDHSVVLFSEAAKRWAATN